MDNSHGPAETYEASAEELLTKEMASSSVFYGDEAAIRSLWLLFAAVKNRRMEHSLQLHEPKGSKYISASDYLIRGNIEDLTERMKELDASLYNTEGLDHVLSHPIRAWSEKLSPLLKELSNLSFNTQETRSLQNVIKKLEVLIKAVINWNSYKQQPDIKFLHVMTELLDIQMAKLNLMIDRKTSIFVFHRDESLQAKLSHFRGLEEILMTRELINYLNKNGQSLDILLPDNNDPDGREQEVGNHELLTRHSSASFNYGLGGAMEERSDSPHTVVDVIGKDEVLEVDKRLTNNHIKFGGLWSRVKDCPRELRVPLASAFCAMQFGLAMALGSPFVLSQSTSTCKGTLKSLLPVTIYSAMFLVGFISTTILVWPLHFRWAFVSMLLLSLIYYFSVLAMFCL